jgi:hypothetical protein
MSPENGDRKAIFQSVYKLGTLSEPVVDGFVLNLWHFGPAMYTLSFLQISPTGFPPLDTSFSILEAHLYPDPVSFEKMIMGQPSFSMGVSQRNKVSLRKYCSPSWFFMKGRGSNPLARISRTAFEAIFEAKKPMNIGYWRRQDKQWSTAAIQTQTLAEHSPDFPLA